MPTGRGPWTKTLQHTFQYPGALQRILQLQLLPAMLLAVGGDHALESKSTRENPTCYGWLACPEKGQDLDGAFLGFSTKNENKERRPRSRWIIGPLHLETVSFRTAQCVGTYRCTVP